jgi:hypothetical protein
MKGEGLEIGLEGVPEKKKRPDDVRLSVELEIYLYTKPSTAL